MVIEGRFPLLEMFRLWVYSRESSKFRYGSDHALSATASGLSEYGSEHALSARFTLNAPLGFFMNLLHAKLDLTTK
ncbi:hypothetical protein JHK82_049110 [Glycine max]|nr:hypothetical protein JHK82_049110 [Glycine max]